MAAKTANLYARIEPETKGPAEAILAALGIPVSTAINMFYKQIILNNGLPFKVQIPYQKPLNLSEMTEDQFNAEIEKGYQSILRGEGVSVDEAFEKIKRAH
ncbi:MAG: type II toxin-antitoxin system RelB/DinJ family antitoxin [Treponema sp.]|nr:type II toxin-antitoxin system RelB/DinJ family antitoxin [Treponema sp.]